MVSIDIEAVLGGPAAPPAGSGATIGESRDGRPVTGHRFGRGARSISLIAGCHADEPVGPAMLDRLAAWLGGLDADHPALVDARWRLVPHANPDGEAANTAWTRTLGPPERWTDDGAAVELVPYLRHVAREAPGDDLEFGFPRSRGDHGARPEARAIAAFLGDAAPLALHGSFHGMAFAAGPWFLIERAWIDRTATLRRRLRRRVRDRGYTVHDIDRRGEKGFERIDRGFTTRPDSRAMAAHFERRDQPGMAALFRPSSMEYARSLGGDPLTLVSEMPLFLLPPEAFPPHRPVHPPATARLRRAAEDGPEALAAAAADEGLRPMPLADQMFFQLAFLDAALEAVSDAAVDAGPGRGER